MNLGSAGSPKVNSHPLVALAGVSWLVADDVVMVASCVIAVRVLEQ
jgi:hypothetical protein